jgi:hypothetical protein
MYQSIKEFLSDFHLAHLFKKKYRTADILFISFLLLYLNLDIIFLNSLKGLGFPYDNFLMESSTQFDYFFNITGVEESDNVLNKTSNLSPQLSTPFTISFSTFLSKLIALTGKKHFILLAIYITLFLGFLLLSLKKTNSLKVIFLSLFSYPIILLLDRGNIFILGIFVLLLVTFASKDLFIQTLSLAIAASIQPFLILFMLPLSSKFHKQHSAQPKTKIWFFFALWFICINAISLSLNQNLIGLNAIDSIGGGILGSKMQDDSSMAYGSSLTGLLFYCFNKTYMVLSFALSAVIIISIFGFNKIKHRITTSQFTYENLTYIICIAITLLLPGFSGSYLVIMLLPLILFPAMEYSFGYLVVYGFILGAKNFLHLNFSSQIISWQIIINPILLMLLLATELFQIRFIARSTGELKSGIRLNYIRQMAIAFYCIILFIGYSYYKNNSERTAHNLRIGLPSDFDPELYLEINPGLQEYWWSIGINESGESLLNRAELHYKAFGSKEGWKYK